jgi:hypothetical protein
MSNDSRKKTFSAPNEDDRAQQIRQRAYELYEEHGKVDGHDQEDWLKAEHEFRAAA